MSARRALLINWAGDTDCTLASALVSYICDKVELGGSQQRGRLIRAARKTDVLGFRLLVLHNAIRTRAEYV